MHLYLAFGTPVIIAVLILFNRVNNMLGLATMFGFTTGHDDHIS